MPSKVLFHFFRSQCNLDSGPVYVHVDRESAISIESSKVQLEQNKIQVAQPAAGVHEKLIEIHVGVLRKRFRSVLITIGYKLPLKLYRSLFEYLVKIHNLLSNKTNPDHIPFELIHGKGILRTNLFHAFGEIGISYTPNVKDVYQIPGEIGIFINFDYFSTAAYIYLLKSEKIVSRNVFQPFDLSNPSEKVLEILQYVENMDSERDIPVDSYLGVLTRNGSKPRFPHVLPDPPRTQSSGKTTGEILEDVIVTNNKYQEQSTPITIGFENGEELQTVLPNHLTPSVSTTTSTTGTLNEIEYQITESNLSSLTKSTNDPENNINVSPEVYAPPTRSLPHHVPFGVSRNAPPLDSDNRGTARSPAPEHMSDEGIEQLKGVPLGTLARSIDLVGRDDKIAPHAKEHVQASLPKDKGLSGLVEKGLIDGRHEFRFEGVKDIDAKVTSANFKKRIPSADTDLKSTKPLENGIRSLNMISKRSTSSSNKYKPDVRKRPGSIHSSLKALYEILFNTTLSSIPGANQNSYPELYAFFNQTSYRLQFNGNYGCHHGN